MHMSMSLRMSVCPLYVWILVMEVRDEAKPTGQLFGWQRLASLCCVVGRRDAYAILLRMSVCPLYAWILVMEVRDEAKPTGQLFGWQRLASLCCVVGRRDAYVYVTAYECLSPLCMDTRNGGP